MTRRDLKEKKKEKCLPFFGQKSLLMLLQTSKVRSFFGGSTVQGTITTFILIIISHNSMWYFCSTKQIFLTEMMYYGLV